MPKFKVQILFSKDFEIEATDKQDARMKASELAGKEIGVTFNDKLFDKFIIQEPKDLSNPAKEKKK